MQLQGLIGHIKGGIRDMLFGHGAPFSRVYLFGIKAYGSVIEHQSRGLKLGFHISKFKLCGLKICNGLTELRAFFHIV